MTEPLLAPDRVTLLLSLVPYLRENGPIPLTDLATEFGVDAKLLRKLVRFLGTAGIPGETFSYQHEDLFDIDWDALEREDLVSLTRTVAVDETPRFAPLETAALVAGLHALTPVLPEEDAETAEALIRRLSAAFGTSEDSRFLPVSVTPEPSDPTLPLVTQAIDHVRALHFTYVDVAGRRSDRTVDPLALEQESGAWYLRAYCRTRSALRSFRVDQMRNVSVLSEPSRFEEFSVEIPAGRSADARPAEAPTGESSNGEERAALEQLVFTARFPDWVLPSVVGFAPELIEENADRTVRVRVEGWHADAVIRFVQCMPGEIVVDGPAEARAAVAAWASRALAAYDS